MSEKEKIEETTEEVEVSKETGAEDGIEIKADADAMADAETDANADAETDAEAEAESETAADDNAEAKAESRPAKFDDDEGFGTAKEESEAKWYVVHTYSGHEKKVKQNIEKIVESRGMQDLVLDIVVPTENRIDVKNGERKVKTKKMFPGYVMVKMIITNESWYLVRNTQGVTGFVGHGADPIPLSNEEVRRMGIEKIKIDLDIAPGDSVKVINGQFVNFMGVVEEVNMEKETLKVSMSMFGRDLPVELDFGQVDKI